MFDEVSHTQEPGHDSAMPSQCHDGISAFVAQALRSLPRDLWPVLLVLPEGAEPSAIDALLDVPGVAGIILSLPAAETVADDRRIGVICEDGTWRLPPVPARSLLFPAAGRLLNVKRSLTAIRQGLRWVLRLDSDLRLKRTPLWRWTSRRLGTVAARLAASVMPVTAKRWQLYREHRLERRLAPLMGRGPSAPAEPGAEPRIVLVNNSLAAGGAERQLVNTARGLADDGRDVSILCYQLGTDEYDFHLPAVGPGLPVSGLRSLLDIMASIGPEQTRRLQRAMHEAGFERLEGLLPDWVVDDVVQNAANLLQARPSVVHFWQDYTNVIGGLAAVMSGVPRVVLGMRNMAPFRFAYHHPFMAGIYRLLSKFDNVVFINNSAAGAADYAAWLDMEPERIQVILNGVEPPDVPAPAETAGWRSIIGLPADAPLIGSVFRFWSEKDPQLWLETAASVAAKRPDARFVLVGDGPLRDEMARHAARLGLGERLFMPGVTRDPHVPMAAMDVFLLTSRMEGTPNVLIEAQMLGVPVVTTVAGGSAETVEHGRTGWVVPERDSQRLGERVLAVLEDEAWRAEAAVVAPDFARRRFGIDRMLAETREVYGL